MSPATTVAPAKPAAATEVPTSIDSGSGYSQQLYPLIAKQFFQGIEQTSASIAYRFSHHRAQCNGLAVQEKSSPSPKRLYAKYRHSIESSHFTKNLIVQCW